MVIQEPDRQSSYLALVGVKLGGSHLDRVDLKMEDRQEDSGIHSLVCLDPFVKIRIVDMLKCTTHTRFMDFGFHE